MPRRMSCSMTIDAVRDRSKTVTRRHVNTWTTLTPGDRLVLIEKGMGLPKGAQQVVLDYVEVIDVRVEPLSAVTLDEVTAEGFGPGSTIGDVADGDAAMSARTFRIIWVATFCRRLTSPGCRPIGGATRWVERNDPASYPEAGDRFHHCTNQHEWWGPAFPTCPICHAKRSGL